MLKIAIIDDEAAARSLIYIYLTQYCQEIVGEIREAESVRSGKALIEQFHPDLVLLDVKMGDGSGFDLLSHFPEPSFQVIFFTAHDHFALRAFEVNAVGYLLKPVDPMALKKKIHTLYREKPPAMDLEKLQALFESMSSRQIKKIALSTTDGHQFIRLADIVHLESSKNYTTFYTREGERITVVRTLKDFESLLPADQFFRVHQSHIVNIDFVKKIKREDGGYILMEDNARVPLSRRKKDEFLELLMTKSL